AFAVERDAGAHCLDAVDRKHARPADDGQTGEPGPVLQILLALRLLGRDLRRAVDRVDRVEHAADKDRPPGDRGAELGRDRLDIVEREIRPRAGTVEEELDLGHLLVSAHRRAVLAAVCPNSTFRASSSIAGLSFFQSLPTASPRCSASRARNVAYQRLRL